MNYILPKEIHIGDRLKQYRELKNIKAAEMARKLEMSRQYYSSYEAKPDIKLQRLLKFCQLLDVPFSFFLSDKVQTTEFLAQDKSIDIGLGNWIDINEEKPEPGMRVLIIKDLRKWDETSTPKIEIANVGYLATEILTGCPSSVTGFFNIKGLYFSAPDILHPNTITYWQPSLDIENCIELGNR